MSHSRAKVGAHCSSAGETPGTSSFSNFNVHIQFDGGSSRSSFATAGFVLVDAVGKELIRRGIVLGPGQTNNDAESAAVALALAELA